MIKLALWGLLTVAVAGLLAAAIFVLARVIAALIGIIMFVWISWWIIKLIYRAHRKRKTSNVRSGKLE